MAIQQSINQGITGAMFLLSQSPMMEARRTKKKLEVEKREELARGEQIAKETEANLVSELQTAQDIVDAPGTIWAENEDRQPLIDQEEKSARRDIADAIELEAYERAAKRTEGLLGQSEKYREYKRDYNLRLSNKMTHERLAALQAAQKEASSTKSNIEGFRNIVKAKHITIGGKK